MLKNIIWICVFSQEKHAAIPEIIPKSPRPIKSLFKPFRDNEPPLLARQVGPAKDLSAASVFSEPAAKVEKEDTVQPCVELRMTRQRTRKKREMEVYILVL